MEKITAKQFFSKWVTAVLSRKKHLLSIWQNSKEYTKYIIGDDNSVIREVAKELSLLCYPYDYYSIDTIFYDKVGLVPNLPENNFWFRDIRVAFEHENFFNSGLYKEVSHLLITNCDLRVLVTYPNDENEAKEKLTTLGIIISGSRQSKVIAKDENFLIIFGYETDFSWQGFVYKQDGWKQI